MCDEVRSAGCAELADGPQFRVTHRDHRLTMELSVPCDLLRQHDDAARSTSADRP